MSLTRKLGRQVKEALKTVEVFINSPQPNKQDSLDEIKEKFNDINEQIHGVIGSLQEESGDDNDKPGDSVVLDHTKYLTEISKSRKPSTLRELTILYNKMPPDTIFLGVGSPNPNLYPFESVTVTLKDGNTLHMPQDKLRSVLSYLPSAGYKPLPLLLKEFQDKTHGPQDWTRKEILVTSGSQEALHLTIDMLLSPGDPLLVQNPVYPGFADLVRPLGMDIIPVTMDGEGIIPERLAKVLQARLERKDKMPKVIYLNPTASNPTGTILSDDRKKQIYRIAQKYDLIILEDDPYFFVHFLEKDPISFLSLDTDDRVIRFDSFSKTVSAGLRLGFATGPIAFIERMNLHLQVTTMHSSGISQLIVHELLASWGYEGYLKYVEGVKAFYKGRRDNILRAAEKYLTGLGDWTTPQGGMFLWIKLRPVRDLRALITEECVKEKLLVAPGYAFNLDCEDESPNVRVSYSVMTEEVADEGLRILGKLVRENIV